jgi:hypothetical protein
MNYKKRDEKKLGKVFDRIGYLNGGDLNDIIESDNKVLRPV